jgi:hypothetical protein
MPLTKIGINLTNLANITTPPTFNFGNTTQEIVDNIPKKANEVSGGWMGFGILLGLFFYLLWKFQQDLYSGGDYGFNINRAIGLSCCICSVLGIYCLNIGYFVNFYHVAIFIIIAFIELGVVWKMTR